MPVDLAEYALEVLKATSAVTDLVMNGATGIMESSDVTAQAITDAQTTRREADNPAKVLAIGVHDAGEKALDARRSEQKVAVWLIDRERGFANIRPAMKAVYAALQGKNTALTSPFEGRTAIITIEMESRTGHLLDLAFDINLEVMTFKAIINLDLG
jgi:hypothetical protein